MVNSLSSKSDEGLSPKTTALDSQKLSTMANLRLFSNSADETKLSSNRRSTTVTVCLETYPFFSF